MTAKDKTRISLAVQWFGVISLLVWAVWAVGSTVREFGGTARAADGGGQAGVFTAHREYCGRQGCYWSGSFASVRNGRPAVRKVKLRGVDAKTIQAGQRVASLDVGARDWVFAAGGAPDWKQPSSALALALLVGVPAVVVLVVVPLRTPWARLRGIGKIDLTGRGGAVAGELLTRERWGPLARPGSAMRIETARPGVRALKWSLAALGAGAAAVGMPALAVQTLAYAPYPEEIPLSLWTIVAGAVLASTAVQVLRAVLLRPRIWVTDCDILIWDSVLLWKVARIRRDTIAAIRPPRESDRYLMGGDHCELSPFAETCNLDIVLRADVPLPARLHRWGNWIWTLQSKNKERPRPLPRRGASYRRMAIRVKHPEAAADDLQRWLGADRPGPEAPAPGFESADHFFHGRKTVHRGKNRGRLTITGPLPQPVAAEIVHSGKGELRATLRVDGNAPGRPLARIPRGESSARTVIDDGRSAEPAKAAKQYLHIDARGPWTLTLTGPETPGEFRERFSGHGADVVAYTGPPGIAVVTAAKPGAYEVRLRGPDLVSRYGNGPAARPRPWSPSSAESVIAVPRRAILQVDADGAWQIRVRPLEPLPGDETAFLGPGADLVRPFDDSVTGHGASVVFYTGPHGTVRASYRGECGFGLHRLSPGLAPVETLVDTTGDHDALIELRPGTLLQVSEAAGEWSLTVE
jgi:hypothetical protein